MRYISTEVLKPYKVLSRKISLPLYLSKVPAGFPSPADDYIDEKLNLDKHLIKNKPATYIVQVDGDSMTGANITSGDMLIVDRSIKPLKGHIVIACLDGELTVKKLQVINRKVCLVAENKKYAPIEINADSDLIIWGVVTFIIHKPLV